MTTLTALTQERRLVTAIPGPKSLEALQRRSEATSGGLGLAFPVVIERASDAILLDLDGNQIIDLGSGIGVTNVGNSAQRVVDRVIDQVQAFTHTCFTVAPYMGYIEVCEKLNAMTPGTFKKKSLLVNSGAEAVENAVKIARHYTKRQAIVVFEHSYHGRTNLTMALTAKNMPYKEGFGPFAPEIYRVPMPYSFHWVGDQATITEDAIEMITHKIDKEIGAHNVAAILIEPIQGVRADSSFHRRDSCQLFPSTQQTMELFSLQMRFRQVLLVREICLLLSTKMLCQIWLLPLRELQADCLLQE
jgi:4-aminobutyrate aminotransferase/(S)-3-amino-2-methylpropionate transaminase